MLGFSYAYIIIVFGSYIRDKRKGIYWEVGYENLNTSSVITWSDLELVSISIHYQ